MRPTFPLAFLAVVVGTVLADEPASVPPTPKSIPRIAPGTRIDVASLPNRTHVVLRSHPKVTSGNVEKIRESILKAIQSFTTVVLVETEPDPDRPGHFRRGAYSIGLGLPDKKGDIILTKATAKQLGIGLGFFDSRVLTERDNDLKSVVSPGSSPTMVMLDFSVAYLHERRRSNIVLRYVALVDANDGHVDTAYFLLEPLPGGPRTCGDSFWLIPQNHSMDWELHVDATKTTFGAPQRDAFSATKLPQGKAFTVPDDLKTAAAARTFTAESSLQFEQRLRDVLKLEVVTTANAKTAIAK